MFQDITRPHHSTPFLIGETVYLRPFEKEDLPLLRTWSNNPEIRKLTGEVLPTSAGASEKWFERMQNDPDRVWFIIALKENDHPIGEAGLLRIFYPWRTSDLTIILGDPFCWGKGYGSEAIHLLLDYAFGALALHRISIGVVGFNERALRFYEKIGFQREGVQRDGYFYNHQFSDFVMMSLLEDEYRALHPVNGKTRS
jgi:RimJ/RimL family protein N-acetyltransferase